ncbi:hypothetical protein L1049_006109 [Liquidambar formosana]|uniref:Uncharacterized protein n=1 Tax=Liquidambar formosana TaxID=63359 RepID=A0AAP0REX0_LIQFO
MATGWVKSLHCKSRAVEDVHNPKPKHLIPSASCRKSVQSIKDVIETTKHHKPRKPKPPPPPQPPQPPPTTTKQPSSKHSRPTKSRPGSSPSNLTRVRHSNSARPARTQDSFFPTLTELPEGHPSRNVVEIIFHTSWSPAKAFSGRIEMIFKVQNLPRTVTRFEEYREMVKSRAGSGGGTWEDDARCIADGNEVMRFQCLGPTSAGVIHDAGGSGSGSGSWAFPGGKGTAICTFSGSGCAHDNAGGGRGRRAMLVCRVIAGRVGKQLGIDSLLGGRVGVDSVSGDNGELLVFDSRAMLPCFLIIYKL